VLLRSKIIATEQPTKKISQKYLGPFKVIDKKGPCAYTLQLSAKLGRIHLTFYISLLEPYKGRPELVTSPAKTGNYPEFEVAEIVAHRRIPGSGLQYEVRWEGYDETT